MEHVCHRLCRVYEIEGNDAEEVGEEYLRVGWGLDVHEIVVSQYLQGSYGGEKLA